MTMIRVTTKAKPRKPSSVRFIQDNASRVAQVKISAMREEAHFQSISERTKMPSHSFPQSSNLGGYRKR